MARRKIQFESGKCYHIYNRGCNKENIFLNEDNYQYLIRLFSKNIKTFNVTIIAYCLMPNHYHLLLRQNNDIGLDRFIQSVFNSYTKAFNKMHSRSGTLFEGPYRNIVVNDDIYLSHLCRYIHRNPLDAGLVKDIRRWKYSNYPEWIETRNGRLVDYDFIKVYFKTSGEYEEFVNDYTPLKKLNKGLEKYLLE